MASYNVSETYSVSQPTAPLYPNPNTVHTVTTQQTTYSGHQPASFTTPIVVNHPVFVTPPGAVLGNNLSDQPMLITCPYCHETITTRVEEEIGDMSWLITILTFFVMPGCNFVFLCSSCLKDKLHFCSKCNRLIGKKKRL